MKKLLLAMALIWLGGFLIGVAVSPSFAQVRPTAMNVIVYEVIPVYAMLCPDNLVEGMCLVPLEQRLMYADEQEITFANVGDIRKVKAIIFSENVPRDMKYQLTVKMDNKTVFKTKKIPLTITNVSGAVRLDFKDVLNDAEGFKFEEPGLYNFQLQVFRQNGNLNKVSFRVCVLEPEI